MSSLDELQRIAHSFGYSHGIMKASIAKCFEVLGRHIVGTDILELGPAEGVMTEMLVESGLSISVVEGSKSFCDGIRQRLPSVKVNHSLFEDFNPDSQYDTIVLGHVLEHVDSPVELLEKVRSWLRPGGKVFAAVPNANSLHRQAAATMGLLSHEAALNQSDIDHGHQRVFDPSFFRGVFYQAHYKIELFGGYWLKPLSNQQIEQSWSPELIHAYMQLGERYPDIAGEIYIVAS
jgi:2-polyprenyl-3-methyl-5-hydroxy-6-metoxy-1,4-benzoquinol methylase